MYDELWSTLVVSDLDGTLLDSHKRLTVRSAGILNEFIAGGGAFTVATARFPPGCADRIAGLDLRLPAVVMNGAATYSFAGRRFERVHPIPEAAVARVERAVAARGAGAFVYALDGRTLAVGCSRGDDLEWTQYNSAASRAEYGEPRRLGPDGWTRAGAVVYIAVVGDDAQLAEVLGDIDGISGVRPIPYRNVYTGRDCLELAAEGTGKAEAVRELASDLGADALVVFGDNLNDVDMMRLADLSFAPANAAPEALAVADEVIPSNDEDGVAVTVRDRLLRPAGERVVR